VETDIEEEALRKAHHPDLAAEAGETSATKEESGLPRAPEVPHPEALAEARESPREGNRS